MDVVKCGHFILVFYPTLQCSKCTLIVIITMFGKGAQQDEQLL